MSKRVYRVLRGGSCSDMDAWILNSFDRYGFEPEGRYRHGGFRLVIKRRKP